MYQLIGQPKGRNLICEIIGIHTEKGWSHTHDFHNACHHSRIKSYERRHKDGMSQISGLSRVPCQWRFFMPRPANFNRKYPHSKVYHVSLDAKCETITWKIVAEWWCPTCLGLPSPLFLDLGALATRLWHLSLLLLSSLGLSFATGLRRRLGLRLSWHLWARNGIGLRLWNFGTSQDCPARAQCRNETTAALEVRTFTSYVCVCISNDFLNSPSMNQYTYTLGQYTRTSHVPLYKLYHITK